jgi:hypothetical protein
MALTLHFPRLLERGGYAVAPGVVLPPGMRVRNPAFLKPRLFRAALTETLLVWDVSAGQARLALGRKVEKLWVRCQTFKKWARVVYARNVKRARALKASSIRVACGVPSGGMLPLKLSPLDQVGDVKEILAKKNTSGMTKKLYKYAVFLNGQPLNDWSTLHDAGIREASSLVVTARAVGTDDDVAPQPYLVVDTTYKRTLMSRKSTVRALAASRLLAPKVSEEERPPVHPRWRPRPRLGRPAASLGLDTAAEDARVAHMHAVRRGG